MMTLDIRSLNLTNQQFFQLCQDNRDLRIECTAKGKMMLMMPAGGGTGNRNLSIGGQLWLWNATKRLGKAFDSSTGFTLPNGNTRSPDVAWIPHAQWDALSKDERERFLPLCPDFVVELRSPSDNLQTVRDKMHEYMGNGARLGWLIDPQTRQVEVYRQRQDVEILDNPTTVSGEDVLPGFVLDMADVWE